MNVVPTTWSVVVLLLQAWSTATAQTKNIMIAPTAMIFSNIATSLKMTYVAVFIRDAQ